MNNSKATLNTYRQSPRKVRLVADAVRGKKVADALDLLTFIPKRAGEPLKKLIASAHANSGKAENLIIKEIKVDAGPVLHRRGHLSYRGGWGKVKKRTSH